MPASIQPRAESPAPTIPVAPPGVGWRFAGVFVVVAVLLLCAGCANLGPPAVNVQELLHDDFFEPSSAHIDEADVFALSEPMRRFAQTALPRRARQTGADPRSALLEALYTRGSLRLHYDGTFTRNAAQAFDERAGNCLSLVIMTAAFAKYLDLPLSYQRVLVPDSYSRSSELIFASGHVNLVLGPRQRTPILGWPPADDLVVDFLPPTALGAQRSERLEEKTIVAMYFNNRAAEAMALGRWADSYAWARAALLRDPELGAAANTLAVLYLHSGHPAAAESALQHVLARNPREASVLSNLVTALQRQGRTEAAQQAADRLARIQPEPPFHFYDLGRQAMAAGDFARARRFFEQELERQPEEPEVHFWAAQADWQLGDLDGASRHLAQARDFSATQASQDLYAGKLARLRAHSVQ